MYIQTNLIINSPTRPSDIRMYFLQNLIAGFHILICKSKICFKLNQMISYKRTICITIFLGEIGKLYLEVQYLSRHNLISIEQAFLSFYTELSTLLRITTLELFTGRRQSTQIRDHNNHLRITVYLYNWGFLVIFCNINISRKPMLRK